MYKNMKNVNSSDKEQDGYKERKVHELHIIHLSDTEGIRIGHEKFKFSKQELFMTPDFAKLSERMHLCA